MDKTVSSATQAVADIPEGASLGVGGFGVCGIRSARNFNPLVATAGRITIAEVKELVEPGALDPDEVHVPGVFVQRVLALTPEHAADKHIEKRTVRLR